ncbi:putative transcription factor WRKY family [Helianthus annuus]|nr:putative transcription factor WRKY family [Helianthus annuus]
MTKSTQPQRIQEITNTLNPFLFFLTPFTHFFTFFSSYTHTFIIIFIPSFFLYTLHQHFVIHIKPFLTRKKRPRKPSLMEEIASLLSFGCKLVKDLEETLPNMANQPHVLISSCDDISKVFGNVRDRLSMAVQDYGNHEAQAGGGGSVSEWLRSSQTMNMQVLHEHEPVAQHGQQHRFDQGVGGQEHLDGSLLRTRRRKHEADRRTIRVPAPRMGNTEVPPEDGYTWRKYGQKEILGSRFPRGYYRCTHQKLYNCPAKKQVQRLDNDPFTFEVTYRGDHTCTMSSTAPSMAPPPPVEAITTHSPPTHLAPTASQSLPQWLSIDLKQSVGDLYSITHQSMQPFRNQTDIANEAGPSSPTNYVDYPRVTDLADTMFNSGSSSNNSMELIFASPNEEKKEGGDNTH